jgi:hypothetical protein
MVVKRFGAASVPPQSLDDSPGLASHYPLSPVSRKLRIKFDEKQI